MTTGSISAWYIRRGSRGPTLHAAAALAHIAPTAAANLLGRMMAREALPIVSRLQPTQVLALAEYMDPRWAAAVARQMDTQTVAVLVNLLPAVRTAAVLGQMYPPEATTLLDLMEPTKKAAVLELVHQRTTRSTVHLPVDVTDDNNEWCHRPVFRRAACDRRRESSGPADIGLTAVGGSLPETNRSVGDGYSVARMFSSLIRPLERDYRRPGASGRPARPA